ncbi:MAG: hypothetical protein FJ039_04575 [Chloroflexi bacterium]|nr:hypothetical protein [Chloroflexota bacterium]
MRGKSAALRPNLATKALWLRWTLLCAAGEIIGIGVAAGVGAGLFSGLSVSSVTGAVLLQLRPKS